MQPVRRWKVLVLLCIRRCPKPTQNLKTPLLVAVDANGQHTTLATLLHQILPACHILEHPILLIQDLHWAGSHLIQCTRMDLMVRFNGMDPFQIITKIIFSKSRIQCFQQPRILTGLCQIVVDQRANKLQVRITPILKQQTMEVVVG